MNSPAVATVIWCYDTHTRTSPHTLVQVYLGKTETDRTKMPPYVKQAICISSPGESYRGPTNSSTIFMATSWYDKCRRPLISCPAICQSFPLRDTPNKQWSPSSGDLIIEMTRFHGNRHADELLMHIWFESRSQLIRRRSRFNSCVNEWTEREGAKWIMTTTTVLRTTVTARADNVGHSSSSNNNNNHNNHK